MGEELLKAEYDDRPCLLVVADAEPALKRALEAAEAAGCRVSGSIGVDGALARIERQAGLNAVLVEIEAAPGAEFDDLLIALQQGAEENRFGSVVSAPLEMIDRIAGLTSHARVQHLCGASAGERIEALGLVSARQTHRLHDIGKERTLPPLHQVSDEMRRIAGILDTLSVESTEARQSGEAAKALDAGQVRAIIRARRLRDQFFGPDLFADPAWDILLDLLAARLSGQRVAVSSLCIAAAVPATTALRWIKTLTDVGLLIRAADPQDGRRVYIELAPQTAAGLEAYFEAAQRISPLNL